jgi:hypothetical protein
LETFHGHLGVLAAAALLHPAILLRKGHALSWRTRLSVTLSTAFVMLAFGSGLWIYPHYRSQVRTGLFHASAAAGFLFETKEHLAYGVVATALGGCIGALAAPKDGRTLRRGAALVYAVSAALCIVTVALGSYVAAVHGFRSR